MLVAGVPRVFVRARAAACVLGAVGLVPSHSTAQVCSVAQTFSIPSMAPSARLLVLDEARGEFVFVARNGSTWTSPDGSAWTQRAAPDAARALLYSSMAYDAARQRVVYFAGYDNTPETHLWDGTQWTLAATQGPATRGGAAMAYDREAQRVLLVGGFPLNENCTNYFGDTWAWDGQQWTLLLDSASGPGIRGDSSMTFDAARGVAVLYGGYRPCTGSLGDTWEFDGTAWTERTPSPAPPSRPNPSFVSGMIFDSVRGRAQLFAGNGSSGIWEWDGAIWQNRVVPGSVTGYVGVAFDPAQNLYVVTGGGTGVATNGVRITPNLPTVTSMSADVYARLGMQLNRQSISVSISSTVSPWTVRWQLNGVAITDTVRFLGVTTPTLLLPSQIRDTDFGVYTCAVTTSCGTTIGPPLRLLQACPADFVATPVMSSVPDGGVTIDDLIFYLFLYSNGNPVSDLDDGSGTGTLDGGVTIDDLIYFLLRFEGGC
jgi:hypothetical protein